MPPTISSPMMPAQSIRVRCRSGSRATVGGVGENARVKHDETHPDRPHPAFEVHRGQRVGRFVDHLQPHNRDEIFGQPRPRQRIQEHAPHRRKIPDHQDVPQHCRNQHQNQEPPARQKVDIGSDRAEKPVRVDRRQLEKHIHRGDPKQQRAFLHLLGHLLFALELAVLRREQIVLLQEGDQFDHFGGRHLQSGGLQPFEKHLQLIRLIHLADDQGRFGTDPEIPLRNRIEQHRIVSMHSGPDQLDVLTQHSYFHIVRST